MKKSISRKTQFDYSCNSNRNLATGTLISNQSWTNRTTQCGYFVWYLGIVPALIFAAIYVGFRLNGFLKGISGDTVLRYPMNLMFVCYRYYRLLVALEIQGFAISKKFDQNRWFLCVLNIRYFFLGVPIFMIIWARSWLFSYGPILLFPILILSRSDQLLLIMHI